MRRVLIGFAVLFIAGAVALALMPADEGTLDYVISMVNVMAVFELRHYALHHGWIQLWYGFALPWLMRPAWLVPANLAIICGGLSLMRLSNRRGKRQ